MDLTFDKRMDEILDVFDYEVKNGRKASYCLMARMLRMNTNDFCEAFEKYGPCYHPQSKKIIGSSDKLKKCRDVLHYFKSFEIEKCKRQ